jgi:predicted Zn-dependent protease
VSGGNGTGVLLRLAARPAGTPVRCWHAPLDPGAAYDDPRPPARPAERGAARHGAAWTALRPWVDSLAAEIAIRAGRLDEAEAVLQDARSLAEVLRDDCWLMLTARGLAEVRARRGRPDEAVSALSDACTEMAVTADPCCWIELSVRDALCVAALDADPAAVPRHAAELAALANRTGLVEFATRAALHRARAGDREAITEARLRAADQGNPALDALVARA